VQDREWSIEELPIPVEGIHIPLPEQYFHALTNRTFGTQYIDGQTANGVSIVYFPGTSIMGDDGYLEAGEIVYGMDNTGAFVPANCDIRLKGY
jgi:hypothetical protein